MLPANAANAMAIADFNKDGILDIFVCSYHGGRTRDLHSYIYWGSPGGIYSQENRARLFTHSASACIAADFNEDGWIDLAVANHKTHGLHPGNSTVWWNGPKGFSEERVTLLPTDGPHGMITVEPGNIMDRGWEEHYISSPFKLLKGCYPQGIKWEANTPPKTWVKAQLRCAPTKESLAQSKWFGKNGPGTWFENGDRIEKLCKGEWVQYRLALGAYNGGNSPRVTKVSVYYGV
ncbi:hypothetical protein AUJ66_00125 [Candidatus Desantisbacteria bacterium CG1_02_38_46]|uniref:VCBS repeat-containing protein n=3 Tax=unclassified Candidatus Desantisiibacteriota TaxID=3106372 RepID=A0A2H9PCI4_9BACT|nr:MAG: hypothetical protein AUJ66_00125 [Candidatus Desantisbacteria bacterium CG1_02_38_46]PIU51907.1 MAG: hypothetical protein COS91_01980 [Candidatus Desantisbacteria bacterium CG07_land_8_20_14_0_80_39_15]PIZ15796.1 MAG: hypothetical protein COY51_04345 [Candidatus Desantisbacteria bacterium CG_4_10_14_0_8_um_filter_39_17]